MRLMLIDHRPRWLPEDFELPPRLQKVKKLYAWRECRHPELGLIGLKLGLADGAAIWDRTGKLVFETEFGRDVGFPHGRKEVLSIERGFGDCADGSSLRNTLRRLEPGTWRTLAEGEICTAMSTAQYLVLDHKGELGAVTWSEQNLWGYTVADIRQLKDLPLRFEWPSATAAPPAFSPDGRLVVSCNFFRQVWWTDEGGDWQDPSPGGSWKVSTLTVHDLTSDKISQHELFVTVDPGWLPDRPEESEWQMVWGPEFISEREFRIWLPDDSEEVLSLPLPSRLEINRPLKRTRDWPQ